MLIFKVIKMFFDTVVNTKGLYEVYGCGWKLICGIWDAATTYMLSPHRVWEYRSKPCTEDLEKQPIESMSSKKDPPSPVVSSAPVYPDLQLARELESVINTDTVIQNEPQCNARRMFAAHFQRVASMK